VRTLLDLCNRENAAVRALYTSEIVGAGKQHGLKFDEKWREPGVAAGPLPALLLRETAQNLERNSKRLALFLGSDFPISRANQFQGAQAQAFAQMRKDRQPRYFYMDDIKLHVAIYPDIASANACVDCHNAHPETPKRDWKLDDMMGATTWTYPADELSLAEAMRLIAVLRASIREAYTAYVDKARTFATPPTIGEKWPKTGPFLPTPEIFMDEAARRSSPETLARLLATR
jgi:hypothetical protein